MGLVINYTFTSLMAGSAGFVIALLYIVFASLVLYPAYLLWSYANAINHLRGGFQINTLKNAIEIQAKCGLLQE